MGKQKSRRQFLQEMGAFTSGAAFLNSPFSIFINSILSSPAMAAGATAGTSGNQPRNYVRFQFYNAPPRWSYDLFLNPYGRENSFSPTIGGQKNQMVATKYLLKNGRYEDVEYSEVKFDSKLIITNNNTPYFRAPHIWSLNVPKSGMNNGRPMSDLLKSLLVIQGIDTKNPAHHVSEQLRALPTGANKSISAMSADASSASFPAINLRTTYYVFKSTKGKSSQRIDGGGNSLKNIVKPFYDFNSKNEVIKSSLTTLIENYAIENKLDKFDEIEKSPLFANQSNVKKFKNNEDDILKQIGDLEQEWDRLVEKYQSLIRGALDGTYAGLNDHPIGNLDKSKRSDEYSLMNFGVIKNVTDLRDLTRNAQIFNLAETFAVVEHLLVNNLSQSISVGVPEMSIQRRDEDGKVVTNDKNNVEYDQLLSDEHGTGKMPSLLINSLRNLAFSACLLELIDILKRTKRSNSTDLWSETVIEVSSEFNRRAREDGTGSDHEQLGASAAIYSGVIKGPLVLGNLDKNNAWGVGAKVSVPIGNINRQLEWKDLAATLAHLLKVNDFFLSDPSDPLVVVENGSCSPKIEKTKRI